MITVELMLLGQSKPPVPPVPLPQVTVQADCGGRICERAYAEEISNCSRVCHTPTYCTWVEKEPALILFFFVIWSNQNF